MLGFGFGFVTPKLGKHSYETISIRKSLHVYVYITRVYPTGPNS